MTETQVAQSIAGELPSCVRLEAKFTTCGSVSVPSREIEALRSAESSAVGAVAVLFWDGVREPHGGWLFVDGAESMRGGRGSVTLSEGDIVRLSKAHRWLQPLSDGVRCRWKSFVAAFHALAMAGHEPLLDELRHLHDSGGLGVRCAQDGGDILESEHRRAMTALIEHHGTSVAGHIFQDLLAYCVGSLGYRTVKVNPVGVPDIEASDFGQAVSASTVDLTLSRGDFDRMLSLAIDAGDCTLADVLKAATRRR